MGSKSFGRPSRFTARTFEMTEAQCQSKYESVGKESSACLLDSSPGSINNPNILPHAGPICRFQKTGTVSSGGLVQSRSSLFGTNKTLPPAANFFSASSHERVTRMFGVRDTAHWADPRTSSGTLVG